MTQSIASSEQGMIDESKYIIRRVKMDRTQAPQDVLNATGYTQFTNSSVVEGMPRGEGGEVEVILFTPEPWEYTKFDYMSYDDLEKCFERRGLIPTDPYSLAGLNRDDFTLADEYPNGTYWNDSDGKWCRAAFHLWHDGRWVDVYRDGSGWSRPWWFAGLRKKTQC